MCPKDWSLSWMPALDGATPRVERHPMKTNFLPSLTFPLPPHQPHYIEKRTLTVHPNQKNRSVDHPPAKWHR
jgi:hypothetical protein